MEEPPADKAFKVMHRICNPDNTVQVCVSAPHSLFPNSEYHILEYGMKRIIFYLWVVLSLPVAVVILFLVGGAATADMFTDWIKE